ncbi:hypothetical protein [Allokutzneria oryzae]|uniref:Uncharacterized protein n=1 Tax=Allokutzneria oryzae TaxID=1378989 RepID=A0ABV5ZRX9_9PSEU
MIRLVKGESGRGMRYYDDEDDPDYEDARTHNDFSGYAQNSVQARDIHGDVNFHSGEREYFTALPWGFSVAAYAVLFLVASAYVHVVVTFDLVVRDWVKLVISTVIVLPVFLATEYRLHGAEFAALRFLVAVIVVALAIHQGAEMQSISGIVGLFSEWLVWRF